MSEVPRSEQNSSFREIERAFGKLFFGSASVERGLDATLTEDEKSDAEASLQLALENPGIRKAVETARKTGWNLILRVPYLDQSRAITAAVLAEKLPEGLQHPEFDRKNPLTTEEIGSLSWHLVSGDILPGSGRQTFGEQNASLASVAAALGIAPSQVRIRSAVEATYDSLVTNHDAPGARDERTRTKLGKDTTSVVVVRHGASPSGEEYFSATDPQSQIEQLEYPDLQAAGIFATVDLNPEGWNA